MEKEIQDLTLEQFKFVVEQYIFNQLHREMCMRKIYDNITFEALAEEFKMSVTNAKTIIKKCKEVLDRHL